MNWVTNPRRNTPWHLSHPWATLLVQDYSLADSASLACNIAPLSEAVRSDAGAGEEDDSVA